MTAITSAASGNWNSTGTWSPAQIPVSGDTVVIANGHTITIPSGYTAVVGSSPADDTGTPAIQCSSTSGTGKLVIASGGNLTYKGPIRQAQGTWTIGAGCTITHDSSGAAVPANAHYTWVVGQVDLTPAAVTIAGVAGNRTVAKIAPGSGASGGWTNAGGSRDCGQVQAVYASISDWGTPSLPAVKGSLRLQAGAAITFDNCLFDRCGKISCGGIRDGMSLRFKNGSFRSPVDSGGVAIEIDPTGDLASVNPTSGDRRFEGAYIEGLVNTHPAVTNGNAGFHFVDVIMTGATSAVSVLSGGVAEWVNVLLYNPFAGTGGAIGGPAGTLTRSILLRSGGLDNPHFIGVPGGTNAPDSTWEGFIAENADSLANGGGDLFQTDVGSQAYNVRIKHGLMLPMPNGKAPASFANHSTANAANGTTAFAPAITVEHCTWPGDDSGGSVGGCGGENNTGYPGLFASVRANLVWLGAAAAGIVCKWNTAQVPGAGTYANADYNGYWNATGFRYFRQDTDPTEYTVTPGAHDVNANPSFVDSTRRFLTWAQSVDPTVTSWADAMNRFSKRNDDAGAIAGFAVSACYDWIRVGWTPTNAALNTSYPADTEQFLGFTAAVPAGPTAGQKLFYRTMQYAASIGALLLSPALSLLGVRHV